MLSAAAARLLFEFDPETVGCVLGGKEIIVLSVVKKLSPVWQYRCLVGEHIALVGCSNVTLVVFTHHNLLCRLPS